MKKIDMDAFFKWESQNNQWACHKLDFTIHWENTNYINNERLHIGKNVNDPKHPVLTSGREKKTFIYYLW